MSNHKIYKQVIPDLPEPERDKTGKVGYDQMTEYVRASSQTAEFYELVEARVIKTYYLESDLDIITKPNQQETRDWNQLGTIDVRMIHNDVLINGVQPLCSHFNCKPVNDERVIVSEYSGRYYYSFPLASLNKVNHNRELKIVGETQVFPKNTFFARPLFTGPGDTTLQGRFGNYINLGADINEKGKPTYPSIVIANNQNKDQLQNQLKKKDTNFPHYHDLNSMGSSITLRSNPVKSTLVKAFDDGEEDFLQGDSIILNSDEIFFNAKKDDIVLTANDDIRIGATAGDVFVSSGPEGRIVLGTKDKSTTKDVKPAVNYIPLKDLLTKFIDITTSIAEQLEGVSKNAKTFDIPKDLEELKGEIQKIASAKVFID